MLGSDPDIDTVNVNNRVQTALAKLPPEVQLEGLTVQKKSSAILQFVVLYSENGKQDPLFITNYAVINVLDVLSRIPGVGQASLFGTLNYSMRIWFDTKRLDNLRVDACGRDQRHPGAERAGAGRPDRRASDRQRSAIPDERADARASDARPNSSATSSCVPIPTALCCAFATSPGSNLARRIRTWKPASTANPRSPSASISLPAPMRSILPPWSGKTSRT